MTDIGPAEATSDPRTGQAVIDSLTQQATEVQSTQDLARLLRALRRRHARTRQDSELTYRELATRTGWSHTAIAEYLTGRTLPPTDRLDILLRLLEANSAELGAVATARDRIEERRRNSRTSGDAAGGSADRAEQTVPRQLPAAPLHFVGRAAELAALSNLADRAPAAGTVVISAVTGMAGIGKTALALYWAHRAAKRFPDGQLYVDLRGFDPAGAMVEPTDVMRRFLEALAIPPQRIPADRDALLACYRTHMAHRRMLIVLDNARDAAQARPLVPGTPGCLVLITSRNRLTGLVAATGAPPLQLDPLTPAEAREMLTNRLGAHRVAAEPGAVGMLIARCARLPLALAIVAAWAATHPDFPLGVLAAELDDTSTRLDILADTDPTTDLRTVFSWSYATLTRPAARMFRLLGLHPGPDASAAVVASLTGLPKSQARQHLAELTHAHLIIEGRPGRYTFHDLLRLYATGLVHRTESAEQQRAATRRLLDHYLHTAHTADRLLNPTRDRIGLLPPERGTTPEHSADHQQALDWFTIEHHCLLAAVSHASALGHDTHTWQLAWALADYHERYAHWRDQITAQRAAVVAAGRLGDRAIQGRAHRLLARAFVRLGHHDDAHTHLLQALDKSNLAGDHIGQAQTHHTLAILHAQQRRYADALHHAQQALNLYTVADNQPGLARALNGVGWYHAELGDHQEALIRCQQALTLHEKLGDRYGQATTWDSLGYIEHHLGHHARAVTCYRHAIALYQELGDHYCQAVALNHLGDTHHAMGVRTAAATAWRQALAILEDLDHPDAEKLRTKLDEPHP